MSDISPPIRHCGHLTVSHGLHQNRDSRIEILTTHRPFQDRRVNDVVCVNFIPLWNYIDIKPQAG